MDAAVKSLQNNTMSPRLIVGTFDIEKDSPYMTAFLESHLDHLHYTIQTRVSKEFTPAID